MTHAIRMAYSAMVLPTWSELGAMLLSLTYVLVFAHLAGNPPAGANTAVLAVLPWLGVTLLAWQWYGVLWKDTAADWVTLRTASLMLAVSLSLYSAANMALIA